MSTTLRAGAPEFYPELSPADVLAWRRQLAQELLQVQRNFPPEPTNEGDALMLTVMERVLTNGETYYVSPDMLAVTRNAVKTWPKDGASLQIPDVAARGFMLFGIPMRSLEEVPPPVPQDSGLNIGHIWQTAWTDANGPDELVVYTLPVVWDPWAKRITPLFEPKWATFELGSPEAPGSVNIGPDFPTELIIMWHLMDQKVTRQRTQTASRAEHKRCTRAGVPSDMVLVTLRHELEGPLVSRRPGEKHYSHRFMVQGHWRNQAYGPGRKQRRPVYVAGFVKGPADKPLVIKERVNAWVR